MRLLLIEDDTLLGEGLRDFLRSDGHTDDWAACLADMVARAHGGALTLDGAGPGFTARLRLQPL